jgi:CBS domain-containing protein
MITVRQLLKTKGNGLWYISPKASIYSALQLMSEKEVGALPVVEEGKLVGIFSERDYARKVILKGRSSLETPVSEIMTPKVLTVQLDETMEKCMELMTDKHVRHLPVLDNGQLVGIISIGDVVKEIITDRERFIVDLQNYIEGTGYGQ